MAANGVLQSQTRIARRNVEGGGRQDHLEHTAFRIVAGMRGDLLKGLSYDAYYQFGTTKLSQIYLNDFSVTRLRRATDVIAVAGGVQVAPGTAGATLECRAAFTGIDPTCVPYNIFTDWRGDPGSAHLPSDTAYASRSRERADCRRQLHA